MLRKREAITDNIIEVDKIVKIGFNAFVINRRQVICGGFCDYVIKIFKIIIIQFEIIFCPNQ